MIELVKNSFDADSSFAQIKIVPPGEAEPSGAIFISDDGHGMSGSDVVEKWFEPATDEKLQRRLSPGGRLMLGAKGIGRFAVARLGDRTHLETVAKSSGRGPRELTKLDIEWGWFSSAKYLDQIDIPILSELLPPQSKAPTGLRLDIRDLRDMWTRKHLEGLIRELRRVTSPSETRDSGFSIRLDITGFNETAHGFNGSDLLSQLNFSDVDVDSAATPDPFLIRPFELQQHADYVLEGTFDEAGDFKGSFTIFRGDKTSQEIGVEAPVLLPEEADCGSFSIKINIYDRETDAIEELFKRIGFNFEKLGILNARRILTENAGIAIFRKGFRIRPYGEPDNDWLELERQRVQNPSRKLGLSQVSGVVTVEEESVSQLIERSSREGLEHNGAYDRLKSLIQGVLLHAEERRFQFRDKAGISRKPAGSLEKVRDIARLRSVSRVAKTLPSEYRVKVEKAIEQDASELAFEIKEIDDYQQILQSRASLGLVLSEVLHEGRRILNPLASSAKLLLDGKNWISEESRRGYVYRNQFGDHVAVIHDGVRDLGRLFKKLDPISGRRRGRPGKFSVCSVVNRAVELFSDQIQHAVIKASVDCDPSLQAFGYEDDLQAALMNILDNAIHWLSTGGKPRRLDIRAVKIHKKIRVQIQNNGPVIDAVYYPRLFDAGFTLKTGGTGLGLAIAREALRRSKGDVVFDDTVPATTFLLDIPIPG